MDVKEVSIDWPKQDLVSLIKRLQKSVPMKDNLQFSTRVEKISWRAIAFNDYSPEDCKKMWILVQTRLRQFRLLHELLSDALDWVSKPWTSFNKPKKTKYHPDMPKRPRTSYVMFLKKKRATWMRKNKVANTVEGNRMIAKIWRKLDASERQKYERLAAKERAEYKVKLEQFYELHPELKPEYLKRKERPKSCNKGSLAFQLFCEQQARSSGVESDNSSKEFKQYCQELWRRLGEEQQLVWISRALEEAKENKSKYFDRTTPVLTKKEKALKETQSGKPAHPPTSGYGLFSATMLKRHDICRSLGSKRMRIISNLWAQCSPKEKAEYSQRAKQMMEQYKVDYANYLNSLAEGEREEEMRNRKPKAKELKIEVCEAREQLFSGEPRKPPIFVVDFFGQKYGGRGDYRKAWKKLTDKKKAAYSQDLVELKETYLKDYETFLKTLSKEELVAYSQFKKSLDEPH